jgi:hypothetical protein
MFDPRRSTSYRTPITTLSLRPLVSFDAKLIGFTNYIVMFHGALEEKPKLKPKTVHLILNGHPEKLYTYSYSKALNRHDIEGICDREWGGTKFRLTRFFSLEGVEIM